MRLSSNFYNPTSIRKDRPLTDEEIFQVAPSIFASDAHESRSERYTYVPTIKVVNELRKEGFMPFFACQTRVKDEERRGHTKHMLRLRHENQINGNEANEIVLLNSHDGTSSYQMLAGMLRFVCSNGLIVGNNLSNVRVHHKGDIVGNIIDGAYTVLETFESVEEQRDTMRSIMLNDAEQYTFAQAALEYRYSNIDAPAPISANQLLQARRFDDRKDDLWSTFNRIQENMTKGGISGRNKHGKKTRTRAVTGIDQDVKLNKALWSLAMEMQKLKS